MKKIYDLGLLPEITAERTKEFEQAVLDNCKDFGCDKTPGKVDEHKKRAKCSLIRECTLTKKCFPKMTLETALDNALMDEKASHIAEKQNQRSDIINGR